MKRGERPRKKTAITLTELEAMLATCDDSLEGLRDRALLGCMTYAFIRVGAVIKLRVKDYSVGGRQA